MSIQSYTWILGVCVAVLALAMLTQLVAAVSMYLALRPSISQAMQLVAQGKLLAQQSKELFGTVKPELLSTVDEIKLLATKLKGQGFELKQQWKDTLVPINQIAAKTKDFRSSAFRQ